LDLDGLCGAANERCKTKSDGSLELNGKGQIQFNPDAVGGLSLAEYIQTPEGQEMAGITGGIQGAKGTLFGTPYDAGSWQDKLIEAFGGSHDMIGGKGSGLYDAEGNIRREMTDSERIAHEIWSNFAILPSGPFAAATLMPAEVWKAISILLEASK
jgi:filamentous hemagglutinin